MQRCLVSVALKTLFLFGFCNSKMSRLYAHIRFLSKFTLFFERKLCVLAVINSQVTHNKNFQLSNVVNAYKWTKHDPMITPVRSFAKDKGKLKKGAPRIPINDQELSEVFNVEKLYLEFRSPVDHLKRVYVEQLNLRTSANSVHDIKVKYDGNTYSIQDLADIRKKTAKDIVLDMGCFPDAIPSVMESLRNSYLNVNPTQDGSSIIVPIPKVTQEYRESSAKKAKAYFNQCKDSIRDIQNKNIKILNNKERLSEDVIYRLKIQIAALGEKHKNEAEELYKAKEKELLSTD